MKPSPTPTPAADRALSDLDPDRSASGILGHAPDPGRYDGQRYEADESTGLVGSFVPDGARVLDVGCGSGLVSLLISTHRHATLVGIEPNARRAALGRARGLEVRTGFLTPELLATLGSFDAIIFTDVLAHLADPAAMLRLVRPALNPGGVVVASLPNVAHWSVRASLLLGRFDHTEIGIMDAAHLRWFTFKTAGALFAHSGFTLHGMAGSAGRWMAEYRALSPRWRRHLLPRLVHLSPALFSCQIIVRAGLPRHAP
ncbi:MAG: class I SAM-dependent methyltransferase [Undibacterium sp.]|nr:class I SAM-dependent methyltransferase [Opitutaceae bacterium]